MVQFRPKGRLKDDAEEYTQALEQVVSGGWRQIRLGQRLGVPQALGLSVPDWAKRIGGYLHLSIPERREAVKELTDEGLSQREIGEVLGVDHKTVHRDQTGANAPEEAQTITNANAIEEVVKKEPPAFAEDRKTTTASAAEKEKKDKGESMSASNEATEQKEKERFHSIGEVDVEENRSGQAAV